MTTGSNAASSGEEQYPARWDWAEGKVLDGTFLRLEQGHTRFGESPIAIISVDGIERSVWLFHQVLRNGERHLLIGQPRGVPEVPGVHVVPSDRAGTVRARNPVRLVRVATIHTLAPALGWLGSGPSRANASGSNTQMALLENIRESGKSLHVACGACGETVTTRTPEQTYQAIISLAECMEDGTVPLCECNSDELHFSLVGSATS
jgi:hypothetical protein